MGNKGNWVVSSQSNRNRSWMQAFSQMPKKSEERPAREIGLKRILESTLQDFVEALSKRCFLYTHWLGRKKGTAILANFVSCHHRSCFKVVQLHRKVMCWEDLSSSGKAHWETGAGKTPKCFKLIPWIQWVSQNAVFSDTDLLTKIQPWVDKLQVGHQTKSVIDCSREVGTSNTFSETTRRTIKELGNFKLSELDEMQKQFNAKCLRCSKGGTCYRTCCVYCRKNRPEPSKKIDVRECQVHSIPNIRILEDTRHGPQQWQCDHSKTKNARKQKKYSSPLCAHGILTSEIENFNWISGGQRNIFDSWTICWLMTWNTLQHGEKNEMSQHACFEGPRRQEFKKDVTARTCHFLTSDTRKEGKNPIFRSRTEWSKYRSNKSCEQILGDKVGVIGNFIDRMRHFHFRQLRQNAKNDKNDINDMNDMNGKNDNIGKNEHSCTEPSDILQGFGAFVELFSPFRVQTTANVVHTSGSNDRTFHRTHFILPCIKTHLVVTCFVVTCSVSWSSLRFRPHHFWHSNRFKRDWPNGWTEPSLSQNMSPRISSKSAVSTSRSTTFRARTISTPTSIILLPQPLRLKSQKLWKRDSWLHFVFDSKRPLAKSSQHFEMW